MSFKSKNISYKEFYYIQISQGLLFLKFLPQISWLGVIIEA